MTTATGTVSSVVTVPSGGFLVADALAGDTVLYLDDAYDFAEEGGQLQLEDGTVLTYATADPDEDTITLASPLDADVWAGMGLDANGDASEDVADYFVAVYPQSTTMKATVEFQDGDEGVLAVIPLEKTPYFAEGIRDPGYQESVVVDDASGTWQVTDIADELAFNGETIDPDTLPTSPLPDITSGDILPDGLVPGQVQNLTATAIGGGIQLRWSIVANPDPVHYDVHMAAGTDAVDPDDAGNIVQNTQSNSMIVLRDPAGVALDPATTYSFVVRAVDADGAGVPSSQVSASPGRIGRTWFQATAPTEADGVVIGDLWFDEDNGNRMYRYAGDGDWTSVADQNKIEVFYADHGPNHMVPPAEGQNGYPDGPVGTLNDLWFDTYPGDVDENGDLIPGSAGNNTQYIWVADRGDGTPGWELAQDYYAALDAAGEAAGVAQGAQDTADAMSEYTVALGDEFHQYRTYLDDLIANGLQPLDDTLTAMADADLDTNQIFYGQGFNIIGKATLTPWARGLLAQTDQDAAADYGNYYTIDDIGDVPTADFIAAYEAGLA